VWNSDKKYRPMLSSSSVPAAQTWRVSLVGWFPARQSALRQCSTWVCLYECDLHKEPATAYTKIRTHRPIDHSSFSGTVRRSRRRVSHAWNSMKLLTDEWNMNDISVKLNKCPKSLGKRPHRCLVTHVHPKSAPSCGGSGPHLIHGSLDGMS